MKKRSILFIFLTVMSVFLISCVGKKVEEPSIPFQEGEARPTVTATTTFVSDIVKRLADDLVDVDLIIPAGEDPHLYEPKPRDLDKLTRADLLIYHGLDFEGRMVEVLEKMGSALAKDFPAERVGVMDDDGSLVVDPHFWFDIDLYKLAVDNVADYLSDLLPEEAEGIVLRAEEYKEDLDRMLEDCKRKMDKIPESSRYLITPHDAFNYFSRTFSIPVMAPQGVSTDSEVANKDIQDTVDFIVEKQIKAIFVETTTDPARMEKLKEAALARGFTVTVVQGEGNELFSDSLAPEGEKGDNFIDMFTHNVDLIVKNLK
ncbi:MAG: zinc ABC transporter substrate-binding protein [Bacillota bacterium]|nr:zinc ABC transporter substrate-binding protein [Bacillota bacterium]